MLIAPYVGGESKYFSMNRKAFYHLLQRYLEGDCTEEEKKLVECWYELLDDGHEPDVPAEEVKGIMKRLWPKIKDQTEPPRIIAKIPTHTSVIPIWGRWLSVAAILVGVAISIFWFSETKNNNQIFKQGKSIANLIKAENNKATNDTVYLADNSVVVLEPNAKLYYPHSFNSVKREVYLEGNAFFQVTKNPKCPFYVYSNNIVTQVLGTSFFIKNNPATNEVEVSVRTGKVAVYADEQEITRIRRDEDSNGVILKPNQKVIYNREDHYFRTTLVDAPLPLLSVDQSDDKITELDFVFEETPLSKVLSNLEDAYHIEIVMENGGLVNCLFSGDIKGQNLYDQLEIICQSVQASYEIRGTKILLKGTGCD